LEVATLIGKLNSSLPKLMKSLSLDELKQFDDIFNELLVVDKIEYNSTRAPNI
jgi:hypothetical protein